MRVWKTLSSRVENRVSGSFSLRTNIWVGAYKIHALSIIKGEAAVLFARERFSQHFISVSSNFITEAIIIW